MINFNGIYAATVVPMEQNGNIDKPVLIDHIEQLSNVEGMTGLLINGHAGENYILNIDEQVEIVKIARSVVSKDTIIVSGINFEDSHIATEVAEKMINNGADSIMIFPPFSWALTYDEDLIYNHHKLIAEKIKSPIMLYQASINAGSMAYNLKTLERLLTIPEVIAIKEGSWETARYDLNRRLVKKIRPDVSVMASGDEHLLTCFMIGTEGSLVSLAIIIPEEIIGLYRSILDNNLEAAVKYHNIIYPLAKSIYGTRPSGYATARLKTCLKLLGKIPRDKMRSAMEPLNNIEIENLKKAISLAGLKLNNYNN